MALAARTSPELIITGSVFQTRKREFANRETGVLEDSGDEVQIGTPGGPLAVTFRKEDREHLPQIMQAVAIVATSYDGAKGSYLSFDRYVTANDLDLIVSAAGLAESRKAS